MNILVAPASIVGESGADREAAIDVDHVSKSYRLYEKPLDFLKEVITGRNHHREKKVLDDISLRLHQGDIVGIIGRNGAGKSTLLKIIAGTLSPTAGKVRVNGRVAAILELGTGFNAQYTGRDNVIMSALMRGMSEAEVRRRLDSIIAFAGLEDVIDQPFHTYSSGMQARLAFAAAVSVEADIIIIDEALAAGDARFAAKSLRRIHEICESGVTALFVSHSTYHVIQLCSRAIWIENGRIRMNGPALDVVRAYEYEMHEAIARDEGRMIQSGGDIASPAATAFEATNSQAPAADLTGNSSLGIRPSELSDELPDLAHEIGPSGLSDELPGSSLGIRPSELSDEFPESSLGIRPPELSDEPLESPQQPDAAGDPDVTDTATPPYEPAAASAEVASAISPTTSQSFTDAPTPALANLGDNELRTAESRARRTSTGEYRILDVFFLDQNGQSSHAFRFGETLKLRVTYECMRPDLATHSCGLAATFNRTGDFEPVMYFSTNDFQADGGKVDCPAVLSREIVGRHGSIEAVIDPIQLRAGEYYVSLGILPARQGAKEYYDYLHCHYRIAILRNGYDEPAIFYPVVSWTNKPIGR